MDRREEGSTGPADHSYVLTGFAAAAKRAATSSVRGPGWAEGNAVDPGATTMTGRTQPLVRSQASMRVQVGDFRGSSPPPSPHLPLPLLSYLYRSTGGAPGWPWGRTTASEPTSTLPDSASMAPGMRGGDGRRRVAAAISLRLPSMAARGEAQRFGKMDGGDGGFVFREEGARVGEKNWSWTDKVWTPDVPNLP